MMSALPPPPPGFKQLTKADQIRYLQNLWDQISQEPPDLPIPESHLQLVEARLKRYREDPSRAHSAYQIIEHLKNSSK